RSLGQKPDSPRLEPIRGKPTANCHDHHLRPNEPLSAEQRTPLQTARRLRRLAGVVQAAYRCHTIRARAVGPAVWSLDDLPPDLEALPEEMRQVAGIGEGIVRLIGEFRSTGTIAELQRLDSRFPADVRVIARLPRMTPGRL